MRAGSWVAVVVALLTVGGAAGAASAHASPRSLLAVVPSALGWINISAVNQYGYSPPELQQVPANATITVRFTDESDMAHTFTIINQEGRVFPTTLTPAQVDTLAYGTPTSNMVNLNVSGPGAVNTTSFNSPPPGWYEFICTVASHFQLGMYGFVAFGMNLPSNLTTVNRTGVGGGLSFNLTTGIVVGALVVVAVGSYVALRRLQARARYGRPPDEKP